MTLPASPQQSKTTYRTTGDLTAAQSWLVGIMRQHQFGRIENMPIQDGQPAPDRDTRIVRAVRLGTESDRSKVPIGDEFELKQPVRDLFDELMRLRSGTIVKLEFRHGLPFLLETIAPVTDS